MFHCFISCRVCLNHKLLRMQIRIGCTTHCYVRRSFYPGASHFDTRLNHGPVIGFSHDMNGILGDHNVPCGIANLENLELDTLPDF